MNLKKQSIIISFVLFFISLFILFYFSTKSQEEKIDISLNNHLEKLSTQYEILLYHQKLTANATFQSIINTNKDLKNTLLKVSQTKNKKELTSLRDTLYESLKEKYQVIKTKGILQFHFVLPNNISFLRLHKPSKFGDNIANIRADFVYVNEHKEIIRGFEQGKTAHGFRHIFPIFHNNGQYLGAVELSFSSEVLQDYLTKVSHLHSHFLVDKSILEAKGWNRDDLVVKYKSSAENPDYLITMTKMHSVFQCINNNKKKLEPISEFIVDKMKKGKPFNTFVMYDKKAQVISFLPVKDIKENKVAAWIVSYEFDPFITMIKKNHFSYSFVAIILLAIFFYFLYKVLVQRQLLNEEVKNKTKELNQSKEKLQQLNETLEQKVLSEVEKNNKIQEQLFKSEKMAAMGEMIGNIAHQWRQPLSVISTGVTGMKIQKEFDNLNDEMFYETCDLINDNAQYLSKTIDDFKNFIKGDQEAEVFILKNTIDSFLHIVEPSIKKHCVKVICDVDENLKLKGFPNELIQCFINFFNNAKDVFEELNINEDQRYIFINIKKHDNRIYLCFKDNAGGISDTIKDKIFEPYFTTKHKSQGTGLGLHMTYNLIVNGMGGDIEVKNDTFEYEDVTYKGANFIISIPL